MPPFIPENPAEAAGNSKIDPLLSPTEFKDNIADTSSFHLEDKTVEKNITGQPSSENESFPQKASPASADEMYPGKDDLNEGKKDNHLEGDGANSSQPDVNLDSKIAKRASRRRMMAELLQIIRDDESDDSASEDDLRDDTKSIAYPSTRKPLSDRMPKSKKRMYQNILYHTLVEDRLRFLETSIRELQKHENLPRSEEMRKTPTIHVSSIRYLTWKEFEIKPYFAESPQSFRHGIITDSGPQSVLEVLIEEPHVSGRIPRHRYHRIPGFKPELSRNDHFGNPTSLKPDHSFVNGPRVPMRLRLRSPLLLKLLEKFVPENLLGEHDKITTTFLRPFKLLVEKSKQIRECLEQLENKHRPASVDKESLDLAADDRKFKDLSLATQVSDEKDRLATQEQESQDLAGRDVQEGLPPPSVNETKFEEPLDHLRILVKFIDEDLEHVWELRRRVLEGSLQKIAFADLWHLFDYGQEVRTPGNKVLQLYRVIKFTGGRELLSWDDGPERGTPAEKYEDYSQGAFYIQCFHLDFNGTHYGPKDTLFMIRRYEGERDINTLAVFPLACDPKGAEIRTQLLKRGTDFAKLSSATSTAHRHKIYSGLTVDSQQEQVDSQVVIDFQWAFLKNPEWKPELGFSNVFSHDTRETGMHRADLGTCGREGCCGNDYIHLDYRIDEEAYEKFRRENRAIWDLIDNVDELSDDDKILLPYRAYGFVLRSRKWATFSIDLLREVAYSGGWKNLELPPGHKQTVLALVQNHTGGSTLGQNREDTFATMDLVRGKGKGLIVLLHGEPGVGKTSTAECVADHTKRPLFPITCGDIGDNAEKVEQNLEDNFQLAHRWGCVLLLDEADVFLQKRDKTDLARNSIVSVFLRTLEYYSGILFLTTNRVGNIDQAFKSRIHLSLLYPRLSRSTTVAIWKNHLGRISQRFKEEEKKFIIEKKDIISFARAHYKNLNETLKIAPWNGRQIRNAFQTAIALAEYEAQHSGEPPTLDSSQFEKVAKTSLQFDFYLKSLYRGRTDAFIAEQDQVRLADFSAEQMNRAASIPMETPSSSSVALPTRTAMKRPVQQREESNSDHSSEDDDMDSDEDEDGVDSEERREESDDERPAEPMIPPEKVMRRSVASKTREERSDDMGSKKPSSSKSKR